jgi:hypothetical protein
VSDETHSLPACLLRSEIEPLLKVEGQSSIDSLMHTLIQAKTIEAKLDGDHFYLLLQGVKLCHFGETAEILGEPQPLELSNQWKLLRLIEESKTFGPKKVNYTAIPAGSKSLLWQHLLAPQKGDDKLAEDELGPEFMAEEEEEIADADAAPPSSQAPGKAPVSDSNPVKMASSISENPSSQLETSIMSESIPASQRTQNSKRSSNSNAALLTSFDQTQSSNNSSIQESQAPSRPTSSQAAPSASFTLHHDSHSHSESEHASQPNASQSVPKASQTLRPAPTPLPTSPVATPPAGQGRSRPSPISSGEGTAAPPPRSDIQTKIHASFAQAPVATTTKKRTNQGASQEFNTTISASNTNGNGKNRTLPSSISSATLNKTTLGNISDRPVANPSPPQFSSQELFEVDEEDQSDLDDNILTQLPVTTKYSRSQRSGSKSNIQNNGATPAPLEPSQLFASEPPSFGASQSQLPDVAPESMVYGNNLLDLSDYVASALDEELHLSDFSSSSLVAPNTSNVANLGTRNSAATNQTPNNKSVKGKKTTTAIKKEALSPGAAHGASRQSPPIDSPVHLIPVKSEVVDESENSQSLHDLPSSGEMLSAPQHHPHEARSSKRRRHYETEGSEEDFEEETPNPPKRARSSRHSHSALPEPEMHHSHSHTRHSHSPHPHHSISSSSHRSLPKASPNQQIAYDDYYRDDPVTYRETSSRRSGPDRMTQEAPSKHHLSKASKHSRKQSSKRVHIEGSPRYQEWDDGSDPSISGSESFDDFEPHYLPPKIKRRDDLHRSSRKHESRSHSRTKSSRSQEKTTFKDRTFSLPGLAPPGAKPTIGGLASILLSKSKR